MVVSGTPELKEHTLRNAAQQKAEWVQDVKKELVEKCYKKVKNWFWLQFWPITQVLASRIVEQMTTLIEGGKLKNW